MQLLKKSFAIAAAWFLLTFITGCLCKCDKQEFYTYEPDTLRLSHTRYTFQGDSTFSIEYFSDLPDTMKSDEYGLVFEMTVVRLAMLERSRCAHAGNLAYACKCPEPMLTPRDPITDIRIFTITDFDASHPANSDATDLFAFLVDRYAPKAIERKPVADILAEASSEAVPAYFGRLQYAFNLNSPPPPPRTAQFMMTITCKSGRTLSALTEEIFLD